MSHSLPARRHGSVFYSQPAFEQETPAKSETYGNEAGEEVGENVISQEACSQHELLGLVVTR